MSWHVEGAGWQRRELPCAGDPDELFFPPDRVPDRAERVAAAKALCVGCPVLATCAGYALDIDATDGVWATVDLRGFHRTAELRAGRAELARIAGRPAPPRQERRAIRVVVPGGRSNRPAPEVAR